MKNSKRTVIVGAGITGLTLAYLLCRDGRDVLLVEKHDRVGGLARSFRSGDFVFDIGPHRFHSDLPAVNDLVREVLAGDERTIPRKSGVHMFDTYFDWPLDFRALFKLPARHLLPVACDLVMKQAKDSGSFEDYIIGRYGRTLYEIFFRPYTEKFLLMPCRDISRDWAITGVDRAVIDKKAQFNDLFSLLRSLLGSSPDTRFIYPASGGIQAFCDRLAERITALGGRIMTAAQVEQVRRSGSRVTGVVVDGGEFACDRLVWTAPINGMLTMLGEEPADLRYLSLLLYNYRVAGAPRQDCQWCYFGAGQLPFNRVSFPVLFNPALAPAGQSGVCVEATCMEGDTLWREPERREGAIRAGLAACGVIGSPDDVSGCDIVRIENAYPIYAMGYREKLAGALEKIGRYGNVKLLGRTGAFWYNNMDHSIEASLAYHHEITGVAAPAADGERQAGSFWHHDNDFLPVFSENRA